MMIKEFGAMTALRASIERQNPARNNGLRLFALAWFVGGLSLAALPAHAARDIDRGAGKSAGEKVTALAAKDPETTSSIRTDMNEGLNCDRSRKRLWVEGEGWIVRRVTTCY
jgi:hypothetical protein